MQARDPDVIFLAWQMEAVLQKSREMVAKHEEAKAARLAVRRAQREAGADGGGVQQSA